MTFVIGSCPLPRAIVSLSISRKIAPTKRVAISDRTAPGLICSTPSHQFADPAGGWREAPRSRPPEEVADRDPNQDRGHEGQPGKVVHHVPEIIRDRFVTGEQRPGLEHQKEEDGADECG